MIIYLNKLYIVKILGHVSTVQSVNRLSTVKSRTINRLKSIKWNHVRCTQHTWSGMQTWQKSSTDNVQLGLETLIVPPSLWSREGCENNGRGSGGAAACRRLQSAARPPPPPSAEAASCRRSSRHAVMLPATVPLTGVIVLWPGARSGIIVVDWRVP